MRPSTANFILRAQACAQPAPTEPTRRQFRLERTLGEADRRKLDEYLTAVRDLERRIARAAQFGAAQPPAGVSAPEMFET
ncbi:MAG: hypothetical protein RL077_382 [Verrucomicrobiota bacterium]